MATENITRAIIKSLIIKLYLYCPHDYFSKHFNIFHGIPCTVKQFHHISIAKNTNPKISSADRKIKSQQQLNPHWETGNELVCPIS